eukprot:CAMPEP_0194113940 /NCGR_PEP_ID=MMETSP0150-20130528/18436_1 /TAXON_ID=122233 /ORGANISM="Chaetoceros debilis, Strain MM31A-1" /LENGTH=933 /DNA_ID=CAMNT_0038804005 /DNA_START=497 /DNA_END=3295 /DNA_ORIENTATION=-
MLSALLASQSQQRQKTPSTNNSPVTLPDKNVKKEASSASNTDFDDKLGAEGVSKIYDRTTKVAKTGYSDHGDHGVEIEESTASDYDDEEEDDFFVSNHVSLGRMTPQKRRSPGFRVKTSISNSKDNSGLTENGSDDLVPLTAKPTSLLHAALIGEGSSASTEKEQPLGECLTSPKEGVSNGGDDNIEGNLITRVNDLIKVPTRNVISHSSSKKSYLKNNDPLGITTLQVMGLLGQGTFAQVFKCKNVDTGDICAVKIIKNKPAYTRQAAIEIEVFKTMLKDGAQADPLELGSEDSDEKRIKVEDTIVALLCYFVYKDHLCLVFELLGQNLYELLKRRQFRGLPIGKVRNIVKQAIFGVTELSQRKIVHCDLKPENILVVSDEETQSMVDEGKDIVKNQPPPSKSSEIESTTKNASVIKLIDFGSACFEGSTGFTYIQSRFYRSPEVLVGVNYDSAIDMWSLGCVAAELFLGLPILPGVHEHDQLGRIDEMIGGIPDWMLYQGKKTNKYFSHNDEGKEPSWKLKTREEFSNSLSAEELKKHGGKSKLDQPPANRYFKYKHLAEIVIHHGKCKNTEEKNSLVLFTHFLKGMLNPDPCERWTAYQASSHPFLTGLHRIKSSNGILKSDSDVNWSPPWDATVCRRKLSLKQGSIKSLKKPKARQTISRKVQFDKRPIQLHSPNTLRVMDMTDALSSISHIDQSEYPPTPSDLYAHHNTQDRRPPPMHYQPSMSIGALDVQNDVQFAQGLSNSLHHEVQGSQGSWQPPPPNMNIANLEEMPISQGVPGIMGPQSFSGLYHTAANVGQMMPQGDLGYALQRPGVVPGGSIPAGIAQQQQMMNQMYMQHPLQMGSHIQASSYTDIGPMSPGSYLSGLHSQLISQGAMSMPSAQLHSIPMPQDTSFNAQPQASLYQSQQQDNGSYNDHYNVSRRMQSQMQY